MCQNGLSEHVDKRMIHVFTAHSSQRAIVLKIKRACSLLKFDSNSMQIFSGDNAFNFFKFTLVKNCSKGYKLGTESIVKIRMCWKRKYSRKCSLYSLEILQSKVGFTPIRGHLIRGDDIFSRDVINEFFHV